MREYLCLVNTSLLTLFGLVIIVFNITKQDPIVLKPRKINLQEVQDLQAEEKVDLPISQIYGRRNIFSSQDTSSSAVKKIYAQKIPKITMPEEDQIPKKPTSELIEPLTIDLNGIIFSNNEEKSICIFSDEAGKEFVFKLGDKVKDGTVIRILKDRAIILRATGQVETFFLHEKIGEYENFKFLEMVKKVNENEFEIDFLKFKKGFESLGQFLDNFDICPAEKNEKLYGVKILNVEPESLAQSLGFKEKDIITAVNNFGVAEKKDRIKAFESVFNSMVNDTVTVNVLRNSNEIEIKYLMEKFKSKQNKILKNQEEDSIQEASEKKESVKTEEKTLISEKMIPEKENSLSLEAAKANEKKYKENIEKIRKELVEKMKNRTRL